MKLCYVENNWAFFTSGPILGEGKQWGDDWDDAPYEHNAGEPYYHRSGYKIVKMAYDGPFNTPADDSRSGNSRYSVEGINKGVTPWLITSSFASSPHVNIFAGVSIEEFESLVRQGSGKVYKFAEETKPKPKLETVQCVFCCKSMRDIHDNGFATRQPDGGGEVYFNFAFGSNKFDLLMEGTTYRGYICDECAEPYVGRMQES